jgi:hypothetical protein
MEAALRQFARMETLAPVKSMPNRKRPRIRSRRIVLLSVAAIFLVLAATLLFKGSVVLVDLHRKVASASLVDGWGRQQKLVYVGFAYVGFPELEGTVKIQCNDGTTVRSGYVTPGAPMWQAMRKDSECTTAILLPPL